MSSRKLGFFAGNSGKLWLVQVLRAFAALLVVVHHAQHEAMLTAARTGAAFTPSGLLPWPAGVDIFFVISGFIIVHAAGPLYGTRGGRARFLAHRVARLVPLYWLVTALYLGLALALPGALSGEGGGSARDPAILIGSFLFWPVARPDGTVLPLYGLGWTLEYEMLFYALFALGLGRSRAAAAGFTVLILGLLVGAALLPGRLPMPLAFWANPIVLEFVFGMALALIRTRGLRLPDPARWALALAGLVLLALAGDPSDAARPILWGGPAALLVAAAALGRRRGGEGGPSLGIRVAALLGDASYALYLVHPFALRLTREFLLRLGLAGALGPWDALVLMVAATLPAAIAVHLLIERPLTALARRRLDPRPETEPPKS